MDLSKAEFDRRYSNGTLNIAFIGMSNIGKSYTALRLATRYDLNLIEVDKIIWENLGHDSMEAFAQWQGHPHTCLLYTSPSPRDATLSRMPSSA